MTSQSHLLQLLIQLTEALQQRGLWQESPPVLIHSNVPFAADILALEEWLQWVFIPTLQQLQQQEKPLPTTCNISHYAQIVWQPADPQLIQLLEKIDLCFVTDTPMDAATIRQNLIAQRKELSLEKRREYQQKISSCITDYLLRMPPQRIAMFVAFPGEVDLRLAFMPLWKAGHSIYIPYTTRNQPLLFVPYLLDYPHWTQDEMHLPVPDISRNQWLDPRQLDVVFTPLVSVDPQGNRIGMGGGYYDRSFAFRKTEGIATPMLLGICYSFQQMKSPFTPQSWDIPMDGLITENGLSLFESFY